ncbi:hypothetical protein HW555_011008 [Spodoptera exigua]|uniref:Uncharacterized protein n=1 Tax=Spodoptera exigua TaxID=7107 RepID=A0A835L109_SPOEX|nr:hypothetical protein HW555_011008 [Spodoptera exigua]
MSEEVPRIGGREGKNRKIKSLEHKNLHLETLNKSLEERITYLEVREQQRNIEICGLEEKSNENLNETIKVLAGTLGLETSKICKFKRVGEETKNEAARNTNSVRSDSANHKKNRPRPVTITLPTRAARNQWLATRKTHQLINDDVFANGNTHRIYVNEDLTKHMRNILWTAKNELKSSFKYIWIGYKKVGCELWAKYCFPDKEYWSPEFQHKLYTEHKMLCNRHFPRTSFSDYPESCKKLHRYAVPDDNKESRIKQRPDLVNRTRGLRAISVPKSAEHVCLKLDLTSLLATRVSVARGVMQGGPTSHTWRLRRRPRNLPAEDTSGPEDFTPQHQINPEGTPKPFPVTPPTLGSSDLGSQDLIRPPGSQNSPSPS